MSEQENRDTLERYRQEFFERQDMDAIAELMPGLILIGTDGGGEGIGLDVRGDGNSVVLVDLNSLRWDEAIYQAVSFEEFLEERLRGEPFSWDAS